MVSRGPIVPLGKVLPIAATLAKDLCKALPIRPVVHHSMCSTGSRHKGFAFKDTFWHSG
jgi:hypothetical protein